MAAAASTPGHGSAGGRKRAAAVPVPWTVPELDGGESGREEFLAATREMGLGDRWAERFWWQKKGRSEDAVKAAEKFCALADKHGYWTSCLDEDMVEEILTGKMWIAEATATGPGVIGMRGKLHDPSAQPHPQTFRCFLVALQFLLASEHAVRQGVVMVVDAEGIGWDNFSLDAERSYMEGMTGLPWQYPALVALNPTMFMSAIMTLVRPFMSRKMQSRLQLLASDQLHAVVGAGSLPSYLGGPVDSTAGATLAKLRAGFLPWITPSQQAELEAAAASR